MIGKPKTKRELLKEIEELNQSNWHLRDVLTQRRNEIKELTGLVMECRSVRDSSNIAIATANKEVAALTNAMENRLLYPRFDQDGALTVYRSKKSRWKAMGL